MEPDSTERAQKAACEYALTLLSRRAYTEKGLYDKLCRRYDEEHAAAAVARMLELNLLDDEDYARRMAADCVNLKGMAPRRTAMELARKGIDRNVIDSVVAELEVDPQPAIARIVKRKYQAYIDDEKGRNKTVNALLRLGYKYDDIAAALRNLDNDEDYYEDWEQE